MLIFSVWHLAGVTLDKNKDKRPSVATTKPVMTLNLLEVSCSVFATSYVSAIVMLFERQTMYYTY